MKKHYVMLNSFQYLLTTILGGAFLCTVFASCNNFLKADEVKKEITKAIEYNNAASYTIRVEAARGSGTILIPAGLEVTKKVTDTFTVKFEPDEAYKFVQWTATVPDLAEGDSASNYIKFEDATSLETTVTFTKAHPGIVITPDCPAIPTATITLEGSNGTFSPTTGEHTIRQWVPLSISYDPNDSYAFLRWKIYDLNTMQELPNGTYLTITDPKSRKTECELTTPLPEDSNIKLCIEAVSGKRPRVISKTPEGVDNPVNKDSRIQVLFDKPMNEKSIYYDKNEIGRLKTELSLEDSDFRKDGDICYGYTYKGKDYFKSIQIVNYGYDTSIADRFGKPYFETPKSLVIPVRGTTASQMPDDWTTILVTIEDSFLYESDEGVPVNLKEAEIWQYLVNADVDNSYPTFESVSVSNKNSTELSTLSSSPVKLVDRTLKMKIQVKDQGTGPTSTFILQIQKTTGGSIKNVSVPAVVISGDAYYPDSTGIAKDFILPDDVVLEEGKTYSLKLLCSDKSAKTTTYSSTYYFSIDNMPPTLSKKQIAISGNGTTAKTDIVFNYQSPNDDYVGGTLYYREAIPVTDDSWEDWSNVTTSKTLASGTAEQTLLINNLEYGTAYEFKAVIKDDANNEQEYLFKKNTMPESYTESNTSFDLNEITRALSITPNGVVKGCTNTIVSYNFEVSSSNSISDSKEINNMAANPFVLKSIVFGGRDYTFKLKSKNVESIPDVYCNKGSYVNENPVEFSKTITTTPPGINGFYNEIDSRQCPVVTESSIKYRINNYNSGFTGVRVYYAKYNDNGTLGAFSYIDRPNIGNYTNDQIVEITGLEPGTHYKFQFKTYLEKDGQTYWCSDNQVVESDAWTAEPNAVVPPDPVSDFKAINQTATTIRFSWTPPSCDFSSYKIFWNDRLTPEILTSANVDGGDTEFIATGLTPDTYYYFKIYVCNEDTGLQSVYKEIPTNTFIENAEQYACTDLYLDSVTGSTSWNATIGYTVPEIVKNSSTTRLILYCADDYNFTVNTSSMYLTKNSSSCQCTSLSSGKKYFKITTRYDSPTTYCTTYVDSQVFVCNPSADKTKFTNFNVEYGRFYNTAIESYINAEKLSWKNGQSVKTLRYKKCNEQEWISIENIYSSYYYYYIEEEFPKDTLYEFELITSLDVVYPFIIKTPSQSIAGSYSNVNISAASKGSDYVVLSWTTYTGCNFTYNIFDVTNSSNTLVADHISGNSFKLTGLNPDTEYTFALQICNGDGQKVINSKRATVRTEVAQEEIVVPVPVSEVFISNKAQNFIQLRWTPRIVGESYIVYYKKHFDTTWSTSYDELDGSDIVYWNKNNLESGTKYDIKIITKYGSRSSNPFIGTFCTNPKNAEINAEKIGTDSIKLSWEIPEENYYAIKIYYTNYENEVGFNRSYEIPIMTIYKTDINKPNSYILHNLNLEPRTDTFEGYFFYIKIYIDEGFVDVHSSGGVSYRLGK